MAASLNLLLEICANGNLAGLKSMLSDPTAVNGQTRTVENTRAEKERQERQKIYELHTSDLLTSFDGDDPFDVNLFNNVPTETPMREIDTTLLQTACEKGHRDIVQYLVEECGADLHVENEEGMTSLLILCENGDLDPVQYLIRILADRSKEDLARALAHVDQEGRTALFLMSKMRVDETEKLELMKMCVENGANVNGHVYYIVDDRTEADAKEEVTETEADGPQKRRIRTCGNIPLMGGCSRGHEFVVKYLIEAGAHPGIERESDGFVPVLEASYNGNFEILKAIVDAGANLTHIMRRQGTTVLNATVTNVRPRVEMIDYLLKCGGAGTLFATSTNEVEMNVSDLKQAILFGCEENIKALIFQNYEPYSKELLNYCLRVALDRGMVSIVTSTLRVLSGTKFSSEVEEERDNLIVITSSANHYQNMMEGQFKKDGSSNIYEALKELVISSMRQRKPIVDENFMAVLKHARLFHPEEETELWNEILSVLNDCLAAPKNSPTFIWFEKYFATSAIWHEPYADSTAFDQLLLRQLGSQNVHYPLISDEDLETITRLFDGMDRSKIVFVGDDEKTETTVRQDLEILSALKIEEDPLFMSLLNIFAVDDPDITSTNLDLSRLLRSKKMNINYQAMLSAFDSQYLSRIASLSFGVMGDFKKEMQKIVSEIVEGDLTALRVAGVKKMARASQKIGTDYNEEQTFPRSARILDMVRCSVAFETAAELAEAFRRIMIYVAEQEDRVKNGGEVDLEGMVGIARLKNGFARSRDGEYQDLKLNLIYHNAMLGKSLVCEVQLILHEFLLIKKEGHRLYAIERKKDVFDLVHESLSDGFLNKYLFQSARSGRIKDVCQAIVLGAQPNGKIFITKYQGEDNFKVPLSIAAEYGHLSIVQLLHSLRDSYSDEESCSPDPMNHQDVFGQTALYWTAFFNHPHVTRFLLDNGADSTLRDHYRNGWGNPGLNACELAVAQESEEVIKVFREFGLVFDD